MNTFGNLFTLTSFGESHGRAIGGVVDGMPAGIPVDMEYIQRELNRRRPGQSSIVTSRKENDRVEFLSGIFEGKTTGTPIGFLVFACRLYIHPEIRGTGSSGRWSFFGSRDDSSLCRRSSCKTCFNSAGHRSLGVYFAGGAIVFVRRL